MKLDSEVEQAAVDEAKALLDDARGQYERGQQLAKTRSMADARVEELRAAFLAAQARLAGARRSVSPSGEIRAPFDGVVGLREVSVGARVETGTKITTLDALRHARARVLGAGAVLRHGSPLGAPIVATTSTYPDRRVQGRRSAASTAGSTRSRAPSASARAFRMRISPCRPACSWSCEIVLDEREALLVPEQAVLIQGRSAFVFRIAGDKAQRVEVQLGQRRFGEVEIRSAA